MNCFDWIQKVANGDEEESKGTKNVPESEVVKFLKKNPNPSDEEFHEWAESKGYNVSSAEAAVYRVASRQVKTASEGGLAHGKTVEDIAKKHGVSTEKIEEQIKKGIKVEVEHTNDKAVAKRIAMDHLMEMSDYYDRLAKMEKEGEKSAFVFGKIARYLGIIDD